MVNQRVLESTIERLKKLPENQLKEASDFIAFLFQKHEDEVLRNGMGQLSENSSSLDFLADEPEIYQKSDLVKVGHKKR